MRARYFEAKEAQRQKMRDTMLGSDTPLPISQDLTTVEKGEQMHAGRYESIGTAVLRSAETERRRREEKARKLENEEMELREKSNRKWKRQKKKETLRFKLKGKDEEEWRGYSFAKTSKVDCASVCDKCLVF